MLGSRKQPEMAESICLSFRVLSYVKWQWSLLMHEACCYLCTNGGGMGVHNISDLAIKTCN